MSKKRKAQFLKRPIRTIFRFNKKELREVEQRAKRAGLSRVEYGRRKMLDLPIADIEAPREETQHEAAATV
jgi:hypothetical protein